MAVIYTPAAPWAGPYPQAVTDNFGNAWQAYGPNQLKKPDVVIEQAEDCCHYTTEVTEELVDGGVPTTPAFTDDGKSSGDTLSVCHPNGLSMWLCDGGVWVLQWVKIIPTAPLACPVGGSDPAPLPANGLVLTSANPFNEADWDAEYPDCGMVEVGNKVFKGPDGRLYTDPDCKSRCSSLGGFGATQVTLDLTDAAAASANATPWNYGPVACINLKNQDPCRPAWVDMNGRLFATMERTFGQTRAAYARLEFSCDNGVTWVTALTGLAVHLTHDLSATPAMRMAQQSAQHIDFCKGCQIPPGDSLDICMRVGLFVVGGFPSDSDMHTATAFGVFVPEIYTCGL